MQLPKLISQWIVKTISSDDFKIEPISGGCINQAFRIKATKKEQYFLKFNLSARSDMFKKEAEGLEALNQQVEAIAPQVIAYSDQALLVEYLSPRSPDGKYWQELGEKLALLHSRTFDSFGFHSDNYCGLTPQVNQLTQSGFEFFAKYRLEYQAKMAFDSGLLTKKFLKKLELISSKLAGLIPEMPAVLTHGDLRSGNVSSTRNGAKIFDPACYFGWAEAELAMTCLFGGFEKEFYQAYEANSGVRKDWRERTPLYNLYHLLNHVNLFGDCYVRQVENILRRYV